MESIRNFANNVRNSLDKGHTSFRTISDTGSSDLFSGCNPCSICTKMGRRGREYRGVKLRSHSLNRTANHQSAGNRKHEPLGVLPVAIGDHIRPVAIGFFQQVSPFLSAGVSLTALRRAIGAYVHSKRYYLALAAIVLDVGTTGDQTLRRRDINLLRPEARGRLNGIFVGTFFLGGALGSALASVAWSVGGWELVCFCLAGFGFLALLADFVRR